MASEKTSNDEAYEEGVENGQNADTFDQVAHSLTKGVSVISTPEETEIYNKGYEYGVEHPADSDEDSDSTESSSDE